MWSCCTPRLGGGFTIESSSEEAASRRTGQLYRHRQRFPGGWQRSAGILCKLRHKVPDMLNFNKKFIYRSMVWVKSPSRFFVSDR